MQSETGSKRKSIIEDTEDEEELLGGFPIEIKTKIRYLTICCYHNFML